MSSETKHWLYDVQHMVHRPLCRSNPERWRIEVEVPPSGILSLSAQRGRCRTSRSFKCNVLREGLSVGSQNIPCAKLNRRGSWVISVYLGSNLMLSGDPVLGHVDVDNRAGLHEQLPQERLIHLEHKTHF